MKFFNPKSRVGLHREYNQVAKSESRRKADIFDSNPRDFNSK
jgi:hypothetical protein